MGLEEGRARAYARHERQQRLARLELSPRQRLEWLEEAKRFAARAAAAAAERRAQRRDRKG